MKFSHIPVMLNEVIENLNIKKDGIYVDGTIGGAGHSKEILKKLGKGGLLIGIDRDYDALNEANNVLSNIETDAKFKLVHGNHDNIRNILDELNIEKVDGILLDLGVSSYQLDEKSRGFSYMDENSMLDMRMDKTQKLTAKDVVNNYKEQDLADIIYEYGEEKFSRKIAKEIVKQRKIKPIETTGDLAKIIENVKPYSKKGHPAKQTFQAIRIEVNNEIKPLQDTIISSINCLRNEGRIAVITFHSLEDRAVKKAFIEAKGECTCPPDFPVCVCGRKSLGKIITKKPILPGKEEMNKNSRSKSAKLRVFERRETKGE